MRSVIVLVVGLAGLLILVVTVRQLRSDSTNGFEVTALAAFASLLALSDSKAINATGISGASQSVQIAAVATVSFAACVVLWRSKGDRQPNTGFTASSLFFLLGAALFLLNMANALEAPLAIISQRFLGLLTLCAIIIVVNVGSITLDGLRRSLYMTLGMVFLAVIFTPDPWRPCSDFKCGPLGAQFTGPFVNENAFAGLTAIAVILALSDRSRMSRFLLIGPGVLVIYLAESRTAQFALLGALFIGLSWYISQRRPHPIVRPMVVVLPGALLGIGLYLVYTSGGADFSGRGAIWTWGREAIGDAWVFGRGLDTWGDLVLERNYMHSEVLFLLYAGGILGLVLYALALTQIANQIRNRQDWPILAILSYILIRGLTEVIWNPISLQFGYIFGLVLVALASLSSVAPTEPPGRGAAATPTLLNNSARLSQRPVARTPKSALG